MTIAEGRLVIVQIPVPNDRPTAKWGRYHWYPATLKTLSPCGRYATIQMTIVERHKTKVVSDRIETKYLQLALHADEVSQSQ